MTHVSVFHSSQHLEPDRTLPSCALLWDEVLPPKGALWTAARWWDKPIPADLAALWKDLACERWWRRTGWLAAAESSGDALQLVTANSTLWELLEELSPEQGKTRREQAAGLHRALRRWQVRESSEWRQAKALAAEAWAGVALAVQTKVDYVSFRVGRPTHVDFDTPMELLDMHITFKVSAGSERELETPTSWYAR